MKAKELNYKNFWGDLNQFIRVKNLWTLFDEPRKTVEDTAYAYEQARALMDPEAGDDLVLHVAACEEYCKVFAFLAYEMGREQGPREEALDDWAGSPEFWAEIKRKWDEEGGLDRDDLDLIYQARSTETEHL